MKTQEYEKKLPLSAEEYEILYRVLAGKSNTIRQINYYYDTPDCEGNTHGITYRIREKNGTYTATVKVHRANVNTEYSGIADAWDDISFFDTGNLIYHGYLTTERIRSNPYENIRLDLDKNNYFQYTDYELEIEYDKGAEVAVLKLIFTIADLLRENGIRISAGELIGRSESALSKSERFFLRKAKTEVAK